MFLSFNAYGGQRKLNLRNTTFNIAGDTIDVISCTKNLHFIFDNTLSMNDDINLVCKNHKMTQEIFLH